MTRRAYDGRLVIPARHHPAGGRVPFVTRLILVLNVAVRPRDAQGDHLEAFVNTFALVPARLFHPALFPGDAGAAVVTIFTAMFRTAGLSTSAGNMLFL